MNKRELPFSQAEPDHPSKHWQKKGDELSLQNPWSLQFIPLLEGQIGMEQSAPSHCELQLHVPLFWQIPWPEHANGYPGQIATTGIGQLLNTLVTKHTNGTIRTIIIGFTFTCWGGKISSACSSSWTSIQFTCCWGRMGTGKYKHSASERYDTKLTVAVGSESVSWSTNTLRNSSTQFTTAMTIAFWISCIRTDIWLVVRMRLEHPVHGGGRRTYIRNNPIQKILKDKNPSNRSTHYLYRCKFLR